MYHVLRATPVLFLFQQQSRCVRLTVTFGETSLAGHSCLTSKGFFFFFLASPTHPPLPHPLPLVRVDQYFLCSLSLMWNWLFVHSSRRLHKDLDGTAPNPNAGWPWRHQHAATGLATGLLPVWDASGKGRQVGFYNSSRGRIGRRTPASASTWKPVGGRRILRWVAWKVSEREFVPNSNLQFCGDRWDLVKDRSSVEYSLWILLQWSRRCCSHFVLKSLKLLSHSLRCTQLRSSPQSAVGDTAGLWTLWISPVYLPSSSPRSLVSQVYPKTLWQKFVKTLTINLLLFHFFFYSKLLHVTKLCVSLSFPSTGSSSSGSSLWTKCRPLQLWSVTMVFVSSLSNAIITLNSYRVREISEKFPKFPGPSLILTHF